MFSPEKAQFMGSITTDGPTAAGQSGRAEVDIPKRDLAELDERSGKRLLREGIYMFELRATDDSSDGASVVKQASVVGTLTWQN